MSESFQLIHEPLLYVLILSVMALTGLWKSYWGAVIASAFGLSLAEAIVVNVTAGLIGPNRYEDKAAELGMFELLTVTNCGGEKYQVMT